MNRVVSQRRLGAIGALGLVAVLAWLVSPTSKDGPVQIADRQGPAQASPVAVEPPPSLVSFDRQLSAAPAIARPVLAKVGQSATTGAAAVQVTVSAPQKLQVGEQNDLVVGLGANAAVGEVGFTVRFDPDVLQVRFGTEGNWAAVPGLTSRFTAEISDAADRVQIRSALSDRRAGVANGSVAVVQFQAVAPGSTSVIVSDVVVKDWAGRPLAFVVSSSNVQVTVESTPPRRP